MTTEASMKAEATGNHPRVSTARVTTPKAMVTGARTFRLSVILHVKM